MALFGSAITWPRWWYSIETLLRRNLMLAILEIRNPMRISAISGEVTNRFRDDVMGIIQYLNRYIHIWGNLIFAGFAIHYMARIDPVITLVTVVPAICVIIVVDAVGSSFTSTVPASASLPNGLPTSSMKCSSQFLAIKVAATERPVVDRFRHLNDERRKSTLIDTFSTSFSTQLTSTWAMLQPASS